MGFQPSVPHSFAILIASIIARATEERTKCEQIVVAVDEEGTMAGLSTLRRKMGDVRERYPAGTKAARNP